MMLPRIKQIRDRAGTKKNLLLKCHRKMVTHISSAAFRLILRIQSVGNKMLKRKSVISTSTSLVCEMKGNMGMTSRAKAISTDI